MRRMMMRRMMMMLLTLGTYCSLGTSTSLLTLGELGELCFWISFLPYYSGTEMIGKSSKTPFPLQYWRPHGGTKSIVCTLVYA